MIILRIKESNKVTGFKYTTSLKVRWTICSSDWSMLVKLKADRPLLQLEVKLWEPYELTGGWEICGATKEFFKESATFDCVLSPEEKKVSDKHLFWFNWITIKRTHTGTQYSLCRMIPSLPRRIFPFQTLNPFRTA